MNTNVCWPIKIFILASIFIISCKKDDTVDKKSFANGVFIVNEGLFASGTGTISFIQRGSSYLTHKIYQQANNSIPIGNIVQSMNIINNMAFIAVNNANRVEIVNVSDFSQVRTLENIGYPAYIIQADSNKAYISSWAGKLVIITLDNTEVMGQIDVGTGPTKMLKVENEIWVLNQGGFGIDSTISVINIATDQLNNTLAVYPRPTGIQKDKNGNIWIMCSGRGFWQGSESEGHLVCIDPADYSVLSDFEFPNSLQHPEKLVINFEEDILYYNYPNGIYKFEISSQELESNPFIPYSKTPYGLAYDPVDQIIYCSDPLDYAQNGLVYRYNANTGDLIDSFNSGIIPGEFCITH